MYVCVCACVCASVRVSMYLFLCVVCGLWCVVLCVSCMREVGGGGNLMPLLVCVSE
jgi:hypothetical protein